MLTRSNIPHLLAIHGSTNVFETSKGLEDGSRPDELRDSLIQHRFHLSKCPRLTPRKKLRRVKAAEHLNQLGNGSRPSGLMASAKARAVISVEVFVEQYVILPVRVCLKFLSPSVDRAPPRLIRAGRSESGGWKFLGPLQISSSSWPEPVGHSILKLSP